MKWKTQNATVSCLINTKIAGEEFPNYLIFGLVRLF